MGNLISQCLGFIVYKIMFTNRSSLTALAEKGAIRRVCRVGMAEQCKHGLFSA